MSDNVRRFISATLYLFACSSFISLAMIRKWFLTISGSILHIFPTICDTSLLLILGRASRILCWTAMRYAMKQFDGRGIRFLAFWRVDGAGLRFVGSLNSCDDMEELKKIQRTSSRQQIYLPGVAAFPL